MSLLLSMLTTDEMQVCLDSTTESRLVNNEVPHLGTCFYVHIYNLYS